MNTLTEAEIYASACGEYRGALEWAYDRLTAIIRRAQNQGGIGANSLAYDCMSLRDAISLSIEKREEKIAQKLRELHETILQGEMPL